MAILEGTIPAEETVVIPEGTILVEETAVILVMTVQGMARTWNGRMTIYKWEIAQ